LRFGAARLGKTWNFLFLAQFNLAVISVFLGLACFEGFLRVRAAWFDAAPSPAVNPSASPPLTMPEDWKRRDVTVVGAARAYWWHNKLHVYNADNMRTTQSFPPKDPATFRIMVIGDSLTYGEGVDAADAWCRVLERQLARHYRVAVLNLGVCGSQSEDIKKILFKHFPSLQPDLVLYGVCLNDFLPSGMGQYDNNLAWAIHFPGQAHFQRKTLVGEYLARKYDDLLREWGVRVNFWTDILRDFQGYRCRFARDVREMNEYVRAQGRPPVLAMCLHQSLTQPHLDQVGLPIIRLAEQALTEAGMQVVPSAGYVGRYAGRSLNVSPWEGHPNEECHRIFAEEFRKAIEPLPCLQPFAKDGPPTPAPPESGG
jgi:hypothetical protein